MIVGVNFRRRRRIELHQPLVHGKRAMLLKLLLQVFAQSGIGTGQLGDTAHKSLHIEHSAADDDRGFALLQRRMNDCVSIANEIRGGVGLTGVSNINELMRVLLQLRGAGFGSTNVHTTVDQRRICADKLCFVWTA